MLLLLVSWSIVIYLCNVNQSQCAKLTNILTFSYGTVSLYLFTFLTYYLKSTNNDLSLFLSCTSLTK
jgi:hypothetical protein